MVLIWLALACMSGPGPEGGAPGTSDDPQLRAGPEGAGDEPAQGPVIPLSAGWMGELTATPTRFSALVESGPREAWIAFYEGDPARAWQLATDPVLARRSAAEQARLYRALADLQARVWRELVPTWVARDAALAEGPLPFLGALAMAAGGQADAARQVPGLGPDERRFIEALAGGPALPATARGDRDGCLRASLARIRGEEGPPSCPPEQELALGGEARFLDPLRLAAEAAVWERRAAAGPAPGATLAERLFDGNWSAEELSALPPLGASDDPEAARARGRAFDRSLTAWWATMKAQGDPEGTLLLEELRLERRARAQALLLLAGEALGQDRPHQASALLMLGHDLEEARRPGPLNPPLRYALEADALLRTGRARQALDPLQALQPSVEALVTLTEPLGDLAILQGMGRDGDSKER